MENQQNSGQTSKEIKESVPSAWNDVERAKMLREWVNIFVSALLPIVILIATCNLKKAEEERANNSRVATLRFEKYGQLSEHLNNIYTYFTYRGQWKEFTPVDIIYEKRAADKIQNMYAFLFSKRFNEKYKQFISACFQECGGGWGKDALLRTEFRNRNTVKPTTRKRDTIYSSFVWLPSWDSLFVTNYPDKMKSDPFATRDYNDQLNSYANDIQNRYNELINLIGDELKTTTTDE